MFRAVWIEVDLKKLRRNYQRIKKYVGTNTKIIATVKQSAYGHGLIPVASELSKAGVDFFGVGSLEEAISLREVGFKEGILVLSAVLSKFADQFIEHDVTPTVVDEKFARELDKKARLSKVIKPVHVKIDTGMGRLGPYYKDAHKFIKSLSKLRNISLDGIFTHFPVADTDPEFTTYQIDIFNKLILDLKKEKISFKYQHCANSLGTVNYPHSHFNTVRPGLILYGIKPSVDIDFGAEPILSLKSKIIFIKKIKKGMGVSYGRTYIAKKPTTVATVAIGYADGYPWSLSGCGKVIIKDSLFNLVGRVCMDHIIVDLGNRNDIKVGDEVILIGKGKNLEITAESLANQIGTIPYEVVSRLSHLIPRTYKK